MLMYIKMLGQMKFVLYFVIFCNQFNLNRSDRAPLFDAVNNLVSLFDSVLTQFGRGVNIATSKPCEVQILMVGAHGIQVSGRPKGTCSICCPLTNIKEHIRFFYFRDRSTNTNNTIINMDLKKGLLRAKGFDRTLKTVIYIHGFCEISLPYSSKSIRDAYQSKNEVYNIILVDWADLCVCPWYVQAAQNTYIVADVVSQFLLFYHASGEITIDKLHIIGFSLGAHIAGFIGEHVRQSGKKVPRITGLDPAFPLFAVSDEDHRLNRKQAEYVDVIHTDPGILGIPVAIGHADFYPNPGRFAQPGCEPGKLAEKQIFNQAVSCNHLRAWQFYSESVINPKAFPTTRCESKDNEKCNFKLDTHMGFPADKKNANGSFYLTTNHHSPFGRTVNKQTSDFRSTNIYRFSF